MTIWGIFISFFIILHFFSFFYGNIWRNIGIDNQIWFLYVDRAFKCFFSDSGIKWIYFANLSYYFSRNLFNSNYSFTFSFVKSKITYSLFSVLKPGAFTGFPASIFIILSFPISSISYSIYFELFFSGPDSWIFCFISSDFCYCICGLIIVSTVFCTSSSATFEFLGSFMVLF